MENLNVGTYDGHRLFTLSTAVVTSTQAIIARKRSGKSYTADVEGEEMLKHKQQIGIVDPTGAHYGLRASADGKSEGYAIVVFGGDHADAPLDWRAGREMALAFIKHGFSAIWDISNFDTEEQIVFVNDLCRELLKSNREAVHIFIDEADTYAPQMLESKAQKVCLGSVRRLVKQGGVRGVGVTLITQRSSDLSKSVLSQVDSMVALTVSHPPDIAPIVEWVSANVGAEEAASIKAEMPKLVIGEAFFCSRGSMRRVKVRLRETFNSGATPKPGERKVEPKVLAAIDMQQLGQKIAESVAEAQANTPEALKRKISELEAQIADGGMGMGVAAEAVEALEEELQELRPLRERVQELEGQGSDIRDAVQRSLTGIADRFEQLKAEITRAILEFSPGSTPVGTFALESPPRIEITPSPERAVGQTVSFNKSPSAFRATAVDVEFLPNDPQQRILNSIATVTALRIPYTDALVAITAGTTARSRGFEENVRQLRGAGLIDKGAGRLVLTEAGAAVAVGERTIPSIGAVVKRLKLSTPQESMLLKVHAGVSDPEQLAKQMDTTTRSRGYEENVRQLVRSGYVVREGGRLRAAEYLARLR